jgi:hypothetical protein
MPHIFLDVSANEIAKYSLEVVIWTVRQSDDTSKKIDEFGSFKIAFYKLFQKDCLTSEACNFNNDQSNIKY